MPAPSNISAATALTVGANSVTTIYVTDIPSDVTKELWFKYTAPRWQLIGICGRDYPDSDYRPFTSFWEGDVGSLTQTTPLTTSVTDTNSRFLMPLPAGETVYLRVIDGNSGSNGNGVPGQYLQFTLTVAASPAVPAGSLLINDDSDLFPAVILDRDTGEVLRGLDVVAGENAAALENGRFLLERSTSGEVVLYDRNGNELARPDLDVVGVTFAANIEISTLGNYFFVQKVRSDLTAGSPNVFIWKLDQSGATADSWSSTLPFTGASSRIMLAVQNDESEFYIGRTGANQSIYYFDPATETFGAELVNNDTSVFIKADICVIPDDSLLVVTQDADLSVGAQLFAKIIRTTDGAVLESFDINGYGEFNRMDLGLDGDSFVVWFDGEQDANSNAIARMVEFSLSDGSEIRNALSYRFVSGVGPTDPEDDTRYLGHSESCPILVLRQPIVADVVLIPDASLPCCDTGCECETPSTPAPGVPPTQGGSPSASPIPTSTGAVLPPVNMLAWTALCEGGGTVPTASDASDTESWVS